MINNKFFHFSIKGIIKLILVLVSVTFALGVFYFTQAPEMVTQVTQTTVTQAVALPTPTPTGLKTVLDSADRSSVFGRMFSFNERFIYTIANVVSQIVSLIFLKLICFVLFSYVAIAGFILWLNCIMAGEGCFAQKQDEISCYNAEKAGAIVCELKNHTYLKTLRILN